MQDVYALDVVVAVLVLLSALVAYFRGFVREALSLASWAGAIAAVLYGYEPVRDVVRGYIPMQAVADLVTGVGIFVVTLAMLSIVAAVIAKTVSGTEHGAVDRSFGFLFGLLRGILLVGVVYMLLSWVIAERDQPPWVTDARVYPVMRELAMALEAMLPGRAALDGRAAADEAERRARDLERASELHRRLLDPRPALEETNDGDVANGGYAAEQRRELEELIRRSR